MSQDPRYRSVLGNLQNYPTTAPVHTTSKGFEGVYLDGNGEIVVPTSGIGNGIIRLSCMIGTNGSTLSPYNEPQNWPFLAMKNGDVVIQGLPASADSYTGHVIVEWIDAFSGVPEDV